MEVCDSIYKADPALETSVSKEIASATKSARDTIATRNPTQLADYPPCAVRSFHNISRAMLIVNFNSFDVCLMLFPRVDVKILTTLSAFADAQPSTRSLLLVNLKIARVMISRVSLFLRRAYNDSFER